MRCRDEHTNNIKQSKKKNIKMKIVCKKLDMYMYLYLIYWQVIRAITYTRIHKSLYINHHPSAITKTKFIIKRFQTRAEKMYLSQLRAMILTRLVFKLKTDTFNWPSINVFGETFRFK